MGPNTDLASNSNISETMTVSLVFPRTYLKEYLINFLMISRTSTLKFSSSVVSSLWKYWHPKIRVFQVFLD